MRFLFIFVLLTLLSCKTTKETTPIESAPEPVVFAELISGTNGGFKEKTNKVITDQTTYNDIWTKAYENFSEKPKPAKIDFENKMLVLVSMGMQRSGGHSIKITSIVETKTKIIVTGEATKPGKNCNTTSVITFPFQVVEIPKSEKVVTFKIMVKVLPCGGE